MTVKVGKYHSTRVLTDNVADQEQAGPVKADGRKEWQGKEDSSTRRKGKRTVVTGNQSMVVVTFRVELKETSGLIPTYGISWPSPGTSAALHQLGNMWRATPSW
jgi:hypothetical protein